MINIDILKAKASFAGDIDNLRDELIYAIDIYRDEANKNKSDNEKLSFEDVLKDFADELSIGRSLHKNFIKLDSKVTRFDDEEVQERIKNGYYNR